MVAKTKKLSPVASPLTENLEVKIPELRLATFSLHLKGDSPLLVHAWGAGGTHAAPGDALVSEADYTPSAIEQIALKQSGAPREKKQPRKPVAEFLAALYPMPGCNPTSYEKGGCTYAKGKFGFPGGAFKLAAIGGCRHVDGMTMTATLGAFHVIGDLVEIISKDPIMRTHTVRVGSGMNKVTTLRYRPEFTDWSVNLKIRLNEAVINPQQIAHLFNVAGFAVGVGEWRPERKGSMGMFSVAANG